MKAKISKKNPYYISHHRYYELKHFCLQYGDWKKEYNRLIFMTRTTSVLKTSVTNHNDYISDILSKAIPFRDKMRMVEETAKETDDVLGSYIFECVTTGKVYEQIIGVPCCRDSFYLYLRRFYWLLDKKRE